MGICVPGSHPLSSDTCFVTVVECFDAVKIVSFSYVIRIIVDRKTQ